MPLCLGLSPSLAAQGAWVLRLAERVVPRLDEDRLQGVEDIGDIMRFLRIGDATCVELEQQLRTCFRFGLVTTADPQARPALLRSWVVVKGLPNSNETFCVLNLQRRLTLSQPTAAPTATSSA